MYVLQILESKQDYRDDLISNLFGEELKIVDSTKCVFISSSTHRGSRNGLVHARKWKTRSGALKYLKDILERSEKEISDSKSSGSSYYGWRKYSFLRDSNGSHKKVIIRSIDQDEWNVEVDKIISRIERDKERAIRQYELKIAKAQKMKNLI